MSIEKNDTVTRIIIIIAILLLSVLGTPLLINEVNGSSINQETITETIELTGGENTTLENGQIIELTSVTFNIRGNQLNYDFNPSLAGTGEVSVIEGSTVTRDYNGTTYTIEALESDIEDQTAVSTFTYEMETETTTTETTTTTISTILTTTISERTENLWKSIPILFIVTCLLAIFVFIR